MTVPESTTPIEAALEVMKSDLFHQTRPNSMGGVATRVTLGRFIFEDRNDSKPLDEDENKVCQEAAIFLAEQFTEALDAQPALVTYLAYQAIHPNAQVMFDDGITDVQYAGFAKQGTSMHEYLRVPSSIGDWVNINRYLKGIENDRWRPELDTRGEQRFRLSTADDMARLHLAIKAYENIIANSNPGPSGQYL